MPNVLFALRREGSRRLKGNVWARRGDYRNMDITLALLSKVVGATCSRGPKWACNALHASSSGDLSARGGLTLNGDGGVAFPVPLLPHEHHRGRVQSRAEASGVVHTCRQDIRPKNQARLAVRI